MKYLVSILLPKGRRQKEDPSQSQREPVGQRESLKKAVTFLGLGSSPAKWGQCPCFPHREMEINEKINTKC